ncbi:Metal-dependent hydrolases of the beta-lactamase superfamily I [Rubrobacter radiotolerans]|uniref:MBL fold metallo-hydrolase n=1 Tax=Rubrobacter radiotolerans TaxID=42256 RepID=A0A023X4F3_RUBRA|nr:MBL fold metallo-hydrolase [Rubrobacter radiotolerans]AHY46890.1 Metal-dependent hydrolases of the beta-lactamase superfamily I [Rubrobacter radiotolerans]MDX5894295.1 MBL fold metallo-hydrolase [Rubrobacter radiotolerans]SMC05663.1 Phosphoribosyl 1,2-cyclic phosphodiesterase [Rubrobacter radiotolerans DSM 5868]
MNTNGNRDPQPEVSRNPESRAGLRFSVLSSGSAGNATYVEVGSGTGETGPTRGLLVDAGLSCRRIAALLRSIGRTLDDVGAILLTHGHSDHTSGLRQLRRERSIPVFSAPGVGEAFGAEILPAGEVFPVLGGSGCEALFFSVPHDAPTYGLRLASGAASMALATDFGEVTGEVLAAMRGVDAAVIEANHDPEWLRRGPYPAHLKARIASRDGHLSNAQAADLALALAPHGLVEVVLAHLSDRNNSLARAAGTVSMTLREAGFGGVRVRSAKAGHPTPWVEVGRPPGSPTRFVYGCSGEVGQLFGVSE